MEETVEDYILNRIYYIGTNLPESYDDRQKFVLLGTPQELIDFIRLTYEEGYTPVEVEDGNTNS